MSWISGEYDEEADKPAPPGSLSPPPPEVRREMLRLELEAQVANLQAEAGAIAAEAAVESGFPIDVADAEPPVDVAAPIDAPPAVDDAPAIDAAPANSTAVATDAEAGKPPA
jgi:hypothetical protein